MLDKRDFAPVGYKRYNKKSAEVPWESVVKGYEYEKGQYCASMTDEDFRRANVKASQTIEIETFVPSAAIPAPYFETPITSFRATVARKPMRCFATRSRAETSSASAR